MKSLIRLKPSHVIFTGTDPETSSGGIGFVMRGYFEALTSIGLPFESIPTYHPSAPGGKSLLWLRALPKILGAIRNAHNSGKQPIIYSHAGAGISLFRESCLLHICKLIGGKTILHIHAPQVDSYLQSWYKRLLFKASLLPARIVVVLTPWWQKRCIARHPIRYSEHKKPYNSEAISVLTMARLVSGKGVDVVVKAMEYLPPAVKLIVAGNGAERSNLEELARKLSLGDRVRFLGWVSGDKKKSLLERADLFCLPSTNDAFPMSFVEAMAYGVPVIGVKWGGITDMVGNGKVGILVDSPDPEQVALSIKKLSDKHLRQRMGEEGKEWVLKMCSAKVVGERLKELFKQLVG
jgi:glycosyltransferase involved in cell wall biosynthesis